MEDIENLLKICEQLRCCANPDEVETLKKSLNRSNIQSKEVEKESDRNSHKNGGSKELGIRNVGNSRMSSVAEESREVDYLIKEVDTLIKEVQELAEICKFGNDPTIRKKKFVAILDDTSSDFDSNEVGLGIPKENTLAKSMIEWIDVCKGWNVLELKNLEKVFNILRLSYELLGDWETKCLLYCSTYPENYQIEIDDLIWLFIDAELLGKNVGMARMFDRGLTILKKLERLALLSMDGDKVCLHDLIRDMTLQIAGSRFMVKAGVGLKGIPNEKYWTDQLEVVSLVQNEIEDISDSSPKCNRLTTLLLKRNKSLGMVCDGFFRYFDGIKLLELSDCKIRTLSKSISLLKNLTALILKNCQFLQHVPSLAELTSLKRLSLNGTRIRQLPEGIGSLIKLRYLNLLNTRIRRISVGVISKLIALQYLAIDAKIEIKELNSLNNLEHLSVKFEDFISFFTFIDQMKNKGRPNSYIFVFGNESLGFIDDMSNQWSEKRIYLRKILSLKQGDNDMMSLVDQYDQLLKILFGNHNTSLGYSFSESWNNLKRSLEIERKTKLFCENELQKLVEDIHLLDIDGGGDLMSLGDFVIDSECILQRQYKINSNLFPI